MSNHEVSDDKKEYITVSDGIKRKTLVHGSKTMLTEFLLDYGILLS